MLEFKVQDLRLRGCGFTLYPAAEEHGVTGELIHELITAIYSKLGLCSFNYDEVEKIQKENPNILDTISKEDFDKSSQMFKAEALVISGLVTINENDLVLTPKAISIIKRATEIQKKLDDENFYYCPCNHF